MVLNERRQQILNLIQKKNSVTVHELSKLFYISETSIRRDLNELEKGGYVNRVYGGAQLAESPYQIPVLSNRIHQQKNEKSIIGKLASELVTDGQTIAMDSSSTAIHMIPYLSKYKQLRIVTNGLGTIEILLQHVNGDIYCIGGLYSTSLSAFTGEMTKRFFSDIHFDIAVFSCKSISINQGIFCMREDEATLRKILINNSNKKILLCDNSKFDKASLFYVDSLKNIDIIVTNIAPSSEWLKIYDDMGTKIIYPNCYE